MENKKISKKELLQLTKEILSDAGEKTTNALLEATIVAYDEAIKSLLSDGYEVKIEKLGTLSSVPVEGRYYRNIQAHSVEGAEENIWVEATHRVKFKPSTNLKTIVKGIPVK